MSNILVTGASGHLGKAVTQSLLKKTNAESISVLVRDANKAADLKAQGVKVLTGNYDDQSSLAAAFAGIDKVYLVSGNDLPNRIKQHGNVVNAAKQAGVKHIVYTSYQRKNETATSPIAFVGDAHLFTERAIKDSGLTYTILQHGIYADMIPIFAGEHLLDNKTIYLPAGEGRTAYALRTDEAEAGTNVLLDETGKYDNQSIELTGSEAVSWSEVAAIISELTGESIKYTSPDNDTYHAALTKAGVPAEYIAMFTAFSNAAKEGEFAGINHNLENILGRKPVTVAEYLGTVYGKK